MGILKRMKLRWKALSTKEKIDLVIDVISGVGSGFGSYIVGNKLSEGRNPIEKICIKTATAGLGLAAGKVASSELKEAYGDPLAKVIDTAKARMAEEKMKEAVANE